MSSSDSDRDHRHKKHKRRRSRSLSSSSSHFHRRSKRSRDRSVERSRNPREKRRRSKERERDRKLEDYCHAKGSTLRYSHHKRSQSSESSSSSSRASKGKRKRTLSKSDAITRNKERIQTALKAVASNDDSLKLNQKQKIEEISLEDQMKRATAIEQIDSAGFTQSDFKSCRTEIPLPKGNQMDVVHSSAMFASSKAMPVLRTNNRIIDPNNPVHLMHPSLSLSVADKMERWKSKLLSLRDKQTKRRFH